MKNAWKSISATSSTLRKPYVINKFKKPQEELSRRRLKELERIHAEKEQKLQQQHERCQRILKKLDSRETDHLGSDNSVTEKGARDLILEKGKEIKKVHFLLFQIN